MLSRPRRPESPPSLLCVCECVQVLALRVLCRLVAQGGPASCALLLRKDEGWLEAVLAHFLSPLVLQVSGMTRKQARYVDSWKWWSDCAGGA